MNAEIDHDLTPDQWEVLKALRAPAAERRGLIRAVVENLVVLGLAAMTEDRPVITRKGRSVLLRGSPRLWDVAA
jgi:ribosomal protein S19E (S16A)